MNAIQYLKQQYAAKVGAGWNTDSIPKEQINNKRVLITGANSGIGYHAALALGCAGAEVIIACRNKERGEAALHKLREAARLAAGEDGVVAGGFALMLVDVSSIKDVRRFADAFSKRYDRLDILINNAGIMMPPYELTAEGFESQLATNHLGHFALTGLLMPLLENSSSPRVVVVSSLAAWRVLKAYAPVDFKKDRSTYDKIGVYGESKLANLLFMRVLAQRFPKVTTVAAHPGASATELTRYQFSFVKTVCQSAESGALPTIRAAVDPDVVSGETYFGPRGGGFAGCPTAAWFPPLAKNEDFAKAYWEASVKATGVEY